LNREKCGSTATLLHEIRALSFRIDIASPTAGAPMRAAALRLIAASVLALCARGDAQAAYCASYFNGGTNCGFSTLAQCLETVRGVGGQCGPAPGAASDERRRPERPEARPRREPERRPAASTPRSAPRRDAAERPPAEPADTGPPVQIVQPPATNTFAAARALLLSGKYPEAIAVLRALNDDGNPDVAASIGYAHSRIGRLEDAKTWYDKALEKNPDHIWALAYYGIWRVAQGDVRSAERDLERVAALCGGTGCIAYRELAEAIAGSPRQ
jgi:tetratricopeptide (TPR) repeat protein